VIPTKDDFIKTSLNRINEWAVQTTGEQIPVVVWTAICQELRSMIEVGQSYFPLNEGLKQAKIIPYDTNKWSFN
jgi:hypothetical protein